MHYVGFAAFLSAARCVWLNSNEVLAYDLACGLAKNSSSRNRRKVGVGSRKVAEVDQLVTQLAAKLMEQLVEQLTGQLVAQLFNLQLFQLFGMLLVEKGGRGGNGEGRKKGVEGTEGTGRNGRRWKIIG